MQLKLPEPTPLRKFSRPAKKLAVTRQRSNTLHDLPLRKEAAKKHYCTDCPVKLSLSQENGLYSPEYKHKPGFYEFAWSIVSARRLRSPSSASHKHNGYRCNAHLSSPLVTISNYRNLVQVSQAIGMSRQLSPNGDIQTNSNDASPDGCDVKEEEQPASVENLVRRSTEYFGELVHSFICIKQTPCVCLTTSTQDYYFLIFGELIFIDKTFKNY